MLMLHSFVIITVIVVMPFIVPVVIVAFIVTVTTAIMFVSFFAFLLSSVVYMSLGALQQGMLIQGHCGWMPGKC